MIQKSQYVSQSYDSLKQSITKMTAGKVLVSCCPESIHYFNQNLLTPAEFLNSVEIQQVGFNMTLREESLFQQPSTLNLKFVDLEEYDNYTKKYYRVSLLGCALENSPSEELLEKLEFVG